MAQEFKPTGYTSVSPYLIVDGAAGTLAFLEKVFGARILHKFPDDHGKLMHSEVRIDDTVLMIANPAPPDWPSRETFVHIYVPDVDATYRKALAAGPSPCRSRSRSRMTTSGVESRTPGVLPGGSLPRWCEPRPETRHLLIGSAAKESLIRCCRHCSIWL